MATRTGQRTARVERRRSASSLGPVGARSSRLAGYSCSPRFQGASGMLKWRTVGWVIAIALTLVLSACGGTSPGYSVYLPGFSTLPAVRTAPTMTAIIPVNNRGRTLPSLAVGISSFGTWRPVTEIVDMKIGQEVQRIVGQSLRPGHGNDYAWSFGSLPPGASATVRLTIAPVAHHVSFEYTVYANVIHGKPAKILSQSDFLDMSR